MTYNLFTGRGFSFDILSDWSFCWFALAIVFFLALILRRQTEDGALADLTWNFPASLILGLLACFLLITLTGDARWALLAGIAGVALGGFGVGLLTGATTE